MKLNITSKINLLVSLIILISSVSFNVLFRSEYLKKEKSDIETHVMDLSRIRGAHFIEHMRAGELKTIHQEIVMDISALEDISDIRIYDKDIMRNKGIIGGPFVPKPVLTESLLKAVRETLDA